MTLKRGTITVNAHGPMGMESLRVNARLLCGFAIHRAVYGSGYTVTHVPTGLAANGANLKTAELATYFILRLMRLPFAWHTVMPESMIDNDPLAPVRDDVKQIRAYYELRYAWSNEEARTVVGPDMPEEVFQKYAKQ